MVFTNTQLLFETMQDFAPTVKRISSGYAEELTVQKRSLPEIPKSVVFSGGISHRIDYHLLNELVSLLPEYQFFFMGEMYLNTYYIDQERDQICFEAWQKLRTFPNVHYLGAFSSEESIRLLPLFECGLIPYDITDVMNFHSHPVKLYEYLASGLPVVSTPIPAVMEYVNRAPVYVAKQGRDLAHLIQKNRSKQLGVSSIHSIQKILSEQSVTRKAEQILAWIYRNTKP